MTFDDFLAEHMPGVDEAQRLIARKAWNAALSVFDRERVGGIVSSYVDSPMLVDELVHVAIKAAA